MFSQDLVANTIKYFKGAYDHDISAETAEAYLDSLAGLFEAFVNLKKNEVSCKIE